MEPEDKNSSEDAYRFITELSAATQTYGLSTTETWDQVTNFARALNWNARFIATPNHVQSVFWKDDDDTQHIRFITTRSGNYDLSKLAEMRNLMTQVEAGEILVGNAVKRLREIISAPSAYGPLMNAIAYVLCGSGFAVILGVSWLDVAFGGLLSLVSFGIAVLANRSKGVATLMEMLAAMMSAIMAGVIAGLIPGIDPMAVTVCAVIFFVPGFGLTIAPNELVLGNTLSGLVWFANACVTMMKLMGGALLGFAMAQKLLPIKPQGPGIGISPLWAWIFVPLLVIGLAILFRVPKRHLVWPLLGSWVVWGGVQIGNAFGAWQGTFLGTVALLLFAHASYRLVRISAAAIILPGIMVLVPGVATLRALYATQTQGIVAGFQSGSLVIALIAAILGGVLVGSAIVSSTEKSILPKRHRAK